MKGKVSKGGKTQPAKPSPYLTIIESEEWLVWREGRRQWIPAVPGDHAPSLGEMDAWIATRREVRRPLAYPEKETYWHFKMDTLLAPEPPVCLMVQFRSPLFAGSDVEVIIGPPGSPSSKTVDTKDGRPLVRIREPAIVAGSRPIGLSSKEAVEAAIKVMWDAFGDVYAVAMNSEVLREQDRFEIPAPSDFSGIEEVRPFRPLWMDSKTTAYEALSKCEATCSKGYPIRGDWKGAGERGARHEAGEPSGALLGYVSMWKNSDGWRARVIELRPFTASEWSKERADFTTPGSLQERLAGYRRLLESVLPPDDNPFLELPPSTDASGSEVRSFEMHPFDRTCRLALHRMAEAEAALSAGDTARVGLILLNFGELIERLRHLAKVPALDLGTKMGKRHGRGGRRSKNKHLNAWLGGLCAALFSQNPKVETGEVLNKVREDVRVNGDDSLVRLEETAVPNEPAVHHKKDEGEWQWRTLAKETSKKLGRLKKPPETTKKE